MKRSVIQAIIFSRKLLVFAVCLFVADRLIGTVLGKLYEKYPDKIYYGIKECREDILVFGSSRGLHHYKPNILSDSLGGSCYNFGRGGQNIYYSYGLLKCALERYRPRMVIMDLMYIDYQKTSSRYDADQLSVFLPFCEERALGEVIELRGRAERIKLLSHLYRYNSRMLDVVGSMFGYGSERNSGYVPLSGTLEAERKNITDNPICSYDYDPKKLEYIEKAIGLCREKGIGIVMTASPIYADMEGRVPSDTLKCMANRYGAVFMNFEQDTAFTNHPELFRDMQHLNRKGSEKYSSEVARRIRELIDAGEL